MEIDIKEEEKDEVRTHFIKVLPQAAILVFAYTLSV